jgi:hypothetical protein
MRWVGETTKYFGRHLQVYRLRRVDLLGAVPSQDGPVSSYQRAS